MKIMIYNMVVKDNGMDGLWPGGGIKGVDVTPIDALAETQRLCLKFF